MRENPRVRIKSRVHPREAFSYLHANHGYVFLSHIHLFPINSVSTPSRIPQRRCSVPASVSLSRFVCPVVTPRPIRVNNRYTRRQRRRRRCCYRRCGRSRSHVWAPPSFGGVLHRFPIVLIGNEASAVGLILLTLPRICILSPVVGLSPPEIAFH